MYSARSHRISRALKRREIVSTHRLKESRVSEIFCEAIPNMQLLQVRLHKMHVFLIISIDSLTNWTRSCTFQPSPISLLQLLLQSSTVFLLFSILHLAYISRIGVYVNKCIVY